ncbi:MAG: GNAT family N-acetyltransferase [Anaerolineae bacterium]|nr:GNAT family N-acetyltransferase [Anaerolineae bacterium]
MAETVIRPANTDDGDAIGELWLALVAYHQALDPALPGAASGGQHRYVRRLLDRLEDRHTCVLVAELDGRVVGYALAMVADLMPDIFDQQASGFLADIYVEPDVRRLGIGRALIESLKAWFRERGVRHFDWHVAAQNHEGIAFWRAIGGQDVMLRMRAQIGEKHD